MIRTIVDIPVEIYRPTRSDVSGIATITKEEGAGHRCIILVPAGPRTKKTIRLSVDLKTLKRHVDALAAAP